MFSETSLPPPIFLTFIADHLKSVCHLKFLVGTRNRKRFELRWRLKSAMKATAVNVIGVEVSTHDNSPMTSPLPIARLEFRYSIQIRIATLHLTQCSYRWLLLSSLRAIIRTVHVRYRAILCGSTVELTAREITVQSSDLILHLVLNANIGRFVPHQGSKLIHVGLRAWFELPCRLLIRRIWRKWSILIPSWSRASL